VVDIALVKPIKQDKHPTLASALRLLTT